MITPDKFLAFVVLLLSLIALVGLFLSADQRLKIRRKLQRIKIRLFSRQRASPPRSMSSKEAEKLAEEIIRKARQHGREKNGEKH